VPPAPDDDTIRTPPARPATVSSALRHAALPAIGLVTLALLTSVYLLHRSDHYSELPKSRPPSAQQVGDDYLRVIIASRDPRSVSLSIGQALYDIGHERVTEVLLPAEPDELSVLEGPKRPSGSRDRVIRPGQIALLAGREPRIAEHEARLPSDRADTLAEDPATRTYPMGVYSVPAEGTGSTSYSIVADAEGTRIFVLPTSLLEEVSR
jgi:hypothetical protein